MAVLKDREDLIGDIRKGLEVAIVVSIFFPSFITTFFDLLQKANQLPVQYKDINLQFFSLGNRRSLYNYLHSIRIYQTT